SESEDEVTYYNNLSPPMIMDSPDSPNDFISTFSIIEGMHAWFEELVLSKPTYMQYHPPEYIQRRLLILEYDVNRKVHWRNFVFRIKNNLTRNESIANNSEFREFKTQVTYFLTLYIKNRSAIIIQQAYRLWKKRINRSAIIIQQAYCLWKKRINSAKIIQCAVRKWLYRPGGTLMKCAQDR
ncbi:3264_t:CDS:2, partial [Dentiscutata erythropus]